VFAGTVAITRFALGGLATAHARTVLLAGASAAAAGAALIAAAPTLLVAGLGLAVAAAGDRGAVSDAHRRRVARRRRVPPRPRDLDRHDRVVSGAWCRRNFSGKAHSHASRGQQRKSPAARGAT
jgi:hypothetical protein